MLTDALGSKAFTATQALANYNEVCTGKITKSAFNHLLQPGLREDFQKAYMEFEDTYYGVGIAQQVQLLNEEIERIRNAHNPST